MNSLHLAIIIICLVIFISQIKLSFEQPSSNATRILQFSNEQYPAYGITGEAITINGTIENLIDKDVTVLFVLQSDGYNTAWHMIESKPFSLFAYDNLTIPADKSINYQYKIRLLTHGTFFFQPRAQVQDLKDASGNYIQYETAGKRGTITITGQDVHETNFVHTGSGASNAKIAVSGNALYVMWQGIGLGNHDDIYLASSVNNGTNFTVPVNISKSKKDSIEPEISVVGRDIFVPYRDNTDTLGEYYDLLVMGSDNYPMGYGIGRISTGYADASSGKITVSGQKAYSVWIENRSGNDTVYFSTSPSNEINFRSHDIISNLGNSSNPQIAADGSSVFLAWETNRYGGTGSTDNSIYYSYSLDGGNTFHTVLVSNQDKNSTNPKIATSNGNVYLAYQDSTNDLVFVKNAENGSELVDTAKLYQGTEHLHLSSIDAKGKNVYVFWTDIIQGNETVFFSASNDSGSTFSKPSRLGHCSDPAFLHAASSESNLYLVWLDRTGAGLDQILFKKSHDNGRTFDDAIVLNNDDTPIDPFVLVSGNNVYVTWNDASPDIYHIFFKASHDQGESFENPIYLEGTNSEAKSNNDDYFSLSTIILGLILGSIISTLYILKRRRLLQH